VYVEYKRYVYLPDGINYDVSIMKFPNSIRYKRSNRQ